MFRLKAIVKTRKSQQLIATIVVVLVAGIGTILLIGSHAASPYASTTADSGTLGGSATEQTCSAASNGNCVVFGGTSTGARGRPAVKNNTFVSDQGTLLRGGTLWLFTNNPSQYNWAVSTPSQQDTDDCTSTPTAPCDPWYYFTEYHLNTVRVSVNFGPASLGDQTSLTAVESEVAGVVAQATANHMYAIIDDHDDSGGHDLASAEIFWTAMANIYKNNTNVLFELLNEPVAWYPDAYTAQDIQDEETLYNIVHTEAPQTPVILLSFAVPENNDTQTSKNLNPSPTMTDVAKELTGVDWTNSAVGFHGYWETNDTGEAQLEQNFPTIDTEFGMPCNEITPSQPNGAGPNEGTPQDGCLFDNTNPSQIDFYQNQVMEELGISWICWDCNSEPGSAQASLASMWADAEENGWSWPPDNP